MGDIMEVVMVVVMVVDITVEDTMEADTMRFNTMVEVTMILGTMAETMGMAADTTVDTIMAKDLWRTSRCSWKFLNPNQLPFFSPLSSQIS